MCYNHINLYHNDFERGNHMQKKFVSLVTTLGLLLTISVSTLAASPAASVAASPSNTPTAENSSNSTKRSLLMSHLKSMDVQAFNALKAAWENKLPVAKQISQLKAAKKRIDQFLKNNSLAKYMTAKEKSDFKQISTNLGMKISEKQKQK